MSPIGLDTHGQYAGEKFLHSSLLLIQSLFLLYVRDALTELDLIKTNGFIAGPNPPLRPSHPRSSVLGCFPTVYRSSRLNWMQLDFGPSL